MKTEELISKQKFTPLFINQSQLQMMLSVNGGKAHNYTVVDMIENGELPEPKNVGRMKIWSVSIICETLGLTKEDIFSFLDQHECA